MAYLVALALHDKAFEQSSLNTASRLLSLQVPKDEKMITVPWRDDILHKPVLRASRDSMSSISSGELHGGVTAKRLKSLGEQMGYPESVTRYWLRRLVLNAVDGLLPFS